MQESKSTLKNMTKNFHKSHDPSYVANGSGSIGETGSFAKMEEYKISLKSIKNEQKLIAMTKSAVVTLIKESQFPFWMFSLRYDESPDGFYRVINNQELLHLYMSSISFKEGLLDVTHLKPTLEHIENYIMVKFSSFSRYYDDKDAFLSKLSKGAERCSIIYMAEMEKNLGQQTAFESKNYSIG